MRTVLVRVAAVGAIGLAVALLLTACGAGSGSGPTDERARVVVTTSILGDVVQNLVGNAVDLEVVMPPGSDPHHFAPSARQVAAMRAADVLVINGLGFEAALQDTIAAAAQDGTVVITASDGLAPASPVEVTGAAADAAMPVAGSGAADPHFFSDPLRMRASAEHIAAALRHEVVGLDSAQYRKGVAAYLAALDDLDGDVVAILAGVPAERRTLVTNHEVFASFADRYGFEVLGTVIPAANTLAEPSASGLRRLADQIARAGVPAIFAETSAPTRLAKALAAEGAGVAVVELYSESLGPPGSAGATYIDMVRTNAERIAAALG